METLSVVLAFASGVVSILSPCVLPLLPIVLTTATSAHRLGPVALTAGLGLSFLTLGVFVATIGHGLGLDAAAFQVAAAWLLVATGVVVMVPLLQARAALLLAPVSRWSEQRFGAAAPGGLGGQFAVGLLLGAVWTPCVGPTLGAAAVLAAQREQLGQVILTMLAFAVGTSLPLLFLGLASRQALARLRGRLAATGAAGKVLVGATLAGTGALMLAGYDKIIEARLLDAMPHWITELTTRF
jgi:cytochrome c biogenesis protein CcdA